MSLGIGDVNAIDKPLLFPDSTYQPSCPPNRAKSWVLRAYVLMPIVTCMYVSTQTIESVAYQMSITKPWSYYDEGTIDAKYMEITGHDTGDFTENTGFRVYDCDQGRHPKATVSCPVTLSNNLLFRSIYFSWVAYFVFLFGFHFYHCLPYEAGDLRFHINYVKVTSGIYQRVYVMLGMLFTIVTVIFALITAYGNPTTATTENATTCFLFGLVNIGLLRDFMIVDFTHLERIVMEKDFPVVIHCDLLPLPERSNLFNLFGNVISSDRVFRTIFDAIMMNHQFGYNGPEGNFLAKLGDAPAIEHAMKVIGQAALNKS